MRPAAMIDSLLTGLVATALAGSLAMSGCSLTELLPSGVIEPAIVPSANERGSRTIDRAFAFENSTVRLEVPMDMAVYAGSGSAPKSAVFIGGKTPVDWVPDYYRAFISESHQASFYDALESALHQIRTRDRLDASRYVELVTSMAQGLEYRTDPVNLAPKFPIETFGDGYGDCDDKTLLAAAVLSRDGYDVAILVFTPEKHVALGIRAPGLDYKQTGYAFVEMTEPSLVGVPTEELAGGIRLMSQPEVIRIGSGTAVFEAGAQIGDIEARMSELRAAEKRLSSEIAAGKADLASEQATLDAEMRAIDGAADPKARDAAVTAYNALVPKYNALVKKVNGLISELNGLVSAERYYVDHQSARPQVYERLRGLKIP